MRRTMGRSKACGDGAGASGGGRAARRGAAVPLGIGKIAVAACAAAAAGWWLFADTVRYHSPTDEAAPLRVSFWGDFEEYKMWQEFRATWLEKHPGVPVKLEYVAVRYTEKIRQLLVAGAAPDVILFQDEPMPGFLAQGKFEDLSDYLARPGAEVELSKYWKTSVDSFGRWEDKEGKRSWRQYGIPVWGGCNLILHNREVFARAGIRVESRPVATDPQTGKPLSPLPPGLRREGDGWVLNDEAWTMDDFVKLCRMLTADEDKDGRIDRFGFWIPGTVYWLPWHWTLGASMLDAERRRVTLYGPECERSLQLWQDLLYKHHVAPTPAELGVMGPNVGFMTGRVAMQGTGPWLMPFLNATDTKYDILHMPRGPDGTRATRITWDAMVLFAGSKKKDQAWRFICHLAGPQCQAILARYQRSIPALKEAEGAFVGRNPHVATRKFVDALGERRYARAQPISEHWDLMMRVWAQARSGLLGARPQTRLTPAEAIGQFLCHKELRTKLPPLDEKQAERYRVIYRRRGKSK